jgi:hypothetical protein
MALIVRLSLAILSLPGLSISVQASGFTVRHHLLGVFPQQVYPSTSQRSSALERNKVHNTLWEKDVIEQTVPIKWEIRYG